MNDNQKSKLLHHSLLMFASMVAGSLLGFFFHIFSARKLGAVEYGELGVLLSLILVFSVVSQSIQITLAKWTTESIHVDDLNASKPGLPFPPKEIFYSVLIFIVVYCLLIPPLAGFLNLPDVWGLLVVGLAFLSITLLGIIRGYLQGYQYFYHLGAIRLIEPAIQLITAVLLINMGFGCLGAISGTTMGIFLASLYALYILKKRFSPFVEIKLKNPKLINYFKSISITLLLITLITNIDILLVKHFLTSGEAGQYAAAAYMGKIMYLTSISISLSMFPKTAVFNRVTDESRALLRKGIVYLSMFYIPFVIICFFFSKEIIYLFFGEDYGLTIEIMPRLMLALSFWGMSYLIINFNVSLNIHRHASILFLILLIQVILISIFHTSLIIITNIMIIIMALLLAILAMNFFKSDARARNKAGDI